MKREHEVLANSMTAVAENIRELVEQAVKEGWTVEVLIEALNHYRASLERIVGSIK